MQDYRFSREEWVACGVLKFCSDKHMSCCLSLKHLPLQYLVSDKPQTCLAMLCFASQGVFLFLSLFDVSHFLFVYVAILCHFHRDKLSANDMLQIKKVQEHVYKNIMGQSDNTSVSGSSTLSRRSSEPSEKGEEDQTEVAMEKVELLCQDQVGLM